MYENGEDPSKSAPQLAQPPTPFKIITFSDSPMVKAAIPTPTVAAASDLMAFDEFETYARCPLQHWYRYVLGLRGEQQKDIAIRARWAIMEALKSFAANPAQTKDSAFTAAWQNHQLPTKSDDAQLWEHANEVFDVGVQVIEQSQGSYAEPDTHIDSFKIRLPWLLFVKAGRKSSIEYLLFSGSLDATSKLWRPMLNGLKPNDADALTMHCLFDRQCKMFKPSGRITNTKAYIAVQKFRAGDREPAAGKHCNWCAYTTFCPTRPL
jgi:CRISPR/Cas system-associated exonuclease Cas4 (RecB family)